MCIFPVSHWLARYSSIEYGGRERGAARAGARAHPPRGPTVDAGRSRGALETDVTDRSSGLGEPIQHQQIRERRSRRRSRSAPSYPVCSRSSCERAGRGAPTIGPRSCGRRPPRTSRRSDRGGSADGVGNRTRGSADIRVSIDTRAAKVSRPARARTTPIA